MLYLRAGDQHVLVVEPADIENLKNGGEIKTPDAAVLLAYSPDVDWLTQKVTGLVGEQRKMSIKEFEQALEESQLRPTIYRSTNKVQRIF